MFDKKKISFLSFYEVGILLLFKKFKSREDSIVQTENIQCNKCPFEIYFGRRYTPLTNWQYFSNSDISTKSRPSLITDLIQNYAIPKDWCVPD